MRGKVGIRFAAISISAILTLSVFASLSYSGDIFEEKDTNSVIVNSTQGHTWANYTTDLDLPQHGIVSGTEANTHGPGVQDVREIKYSGLGVIINQFYTGADWAELYNDGPIDVDMAGWSFYWYDQRGFDGTYVVPSGPLYTISVGEFVYLLENTGTDTDSAWYIGQNMMWDATSGGIAAEIRNPSGQGVDFFRTGNATLLPTPPCQWFFPDISHPVVDGGAYRDDVGIENDIEYDSGLDWRDTGSQPPITHITFYSLEHKWRMQQLPGNATDLTLHITAFTNSGSNDNYRFFYSSDDVNWIDTGIMVNSDTPEEYTFSMPTSLSGVTYLRVTDSNYWDSSSQDYVYVDEIRIQYHNVTYDTFDISLSEGWNLISFPLEQSVESIDQVLLSINGKWDRIQAYDAVNGIWQSNATIKPNQLNDLDALNHKQGFWINITQPNVTLVVSGFIINSTTINLYAGWNLVGYPSLTNETVANALWGTGADTVMICDTSEQYHIKEVAPTYLMKPGEGYWVHVIADTVWVVDW